MSAKRIHIDDLTPEQAREWLIANNPEGADYWRSAPADDLREAVEDNLTDFGVTEQDGDICVELGRRRWVGVRAYTKRFVLFLVPFLVVAFFLISQGGKASAWTWALAVWVAALLAVIAWPDDTAARPKAEGGDR